MKVTIKDVAKAVGVSASTVSRALRDHPRISPEVRQRVQQAAREMDFHPNQMARSLVNRQTRIVGIVFPGDMDQSMGHPFYPSVLQGLGHEATRQRYHMLLAGGSEGESSADAGRRLVESGYISGLILLAAEDAPAGEMTLPTVVVGHPSQSGLCYYVDNNNVEAGRQAVDYLLKRGHRRVLFLGYDKQFMVTVNRMRGYRAGLEKAGVPFRRDWVVPSQFNRSQPDPQLIRRIFQQPDHPTAVVCMDDAQAIALCGLLSDMGLRVPQDVSLISFNNTVSGRYHTPALTSFDVNARQLGMSAMQLMLQVLEEGRTGPAYIEVPFTLVERDSVRDWTEE